MLFDRVHASHKLKRATKREASVNLNPASVNAYAAKSNVTSQYLLDTLLFSTKKYNSEYLLNQDHKMNPRRMQGRPFQVTEKFAPPHLVTNQDFARYSVPPWVLEM